MQPTPCVRLNRRSGKLPIVALALALLLGQGQSFSFRSLAATPSNLDAHPAAHAFTTLSGPRANRGSELSGFGLHGGIPEFGTPKEAQGVNSPQLDEAPALSADGLTLFFASRRPGGAGYWDVWQATRPNRRAAFDTPVDVMALNTPAYEAHPCISADSLTIIFDRDRWDGRGEDLWVAARPSTSASWSEPVPVAELNTTYQDSAASISEDGKVVVFWSNRPGGHSNSGEAGYLGERDLWESRRSNPTEPFGPPAPLLSINTGFVEMHPSVSADGLTVYFESTRPKSAGDTPDDYNIWAAFRSDLSSPFGPAQLVTGTVSPQGYYEGQPNISYDGKELFFVRDHGGWQDDFDIWVAARVAKIYLPTVVSEPTGCEICPR